MSKYLSWIGVLLVLVVFHLGSKAEAQIVELDDGFLYASPTLMLGINFDFSGDGGLEFYPSLSAQVTGGRSIEDGLAGATLGYQFSWAHPKISMLTFKPVSDC